MFNLLPKGGIQNDYDKPFYRRQKNSRNSTQYEKEELSLFYFIFIYMYAIGKTLKKLFLFHIFIYVILYNV